MADENKINLEAVKNFSEQLASLYECKMPISKSKMLEITDAALKAIKLYKHVVMTLEKFIQKCTSDYKIPGLYVMDSIIRKSKHRFKNKDVFGARFEKNFPQTFDLIYSSGTIDDKKRALKVVKLWLESSIMNKEVLASCLNKGLSDGIEFEVTQKKASPPRAAEEDDLKSKQFVNQLNSLANTLRETNNIDRHYDNIDPVTGAPLPRRSSIDENVSGILANAVGGYSDDEEEDRQSKRHKRRHSRSISRERDAKRDRRSRRSRSRDRSKRSRSKDSRIDESRREKKDETAEEKEQRRLMLPPVRPQHLLIASRILWLGRLPNLTNADDIASEVHRQLMKDEQPRPSVEHIQAAACAFVTFHDRRSAVKAYEKSQSRSRPFTMQARCPRISWASAKSIKDLGEWDEKNGVSYLHWGELARNTLSSMVANAHLVLASLPVEMRGKFNQQGLAIDQPGSVPLPPGAVPLPPGAPVSLPSAPMPPVSLPSGAVPPNTTLPPPSWPPYQRALYPHDQRGFHRARLPVVGVLGLPYPMYPPMPHGMGLPFTHPPPMLPIDDTTKAVSVQKRKSRFDQTGDCNGATQTMERFTGAPMQNSIARQTNDDEDLLPPGL